MVKVDTIYEVDPYEKIKRLEEELDVIRRIVLDMVPKKYRELLNGYCKCKTLEEFGEWQRLVFDKVISDASTEATEYYGGEYAVCPLCGDESRSTFYKGFKIPGGLANHLGGSFGARECGVMYVLSWYSRRQEVRLFQKEQEEKEKIYSQRRQKEIQYITRPEGKPELIDEGISRLNEPRNKGQLLWAESRIAQLGFTTKLDGNIKTYINENDNSIAFADPRVVGHIRINVYKKPLPTKERYSGIITSFSFMDTWKHDLLKKYEDRVMGRKR